MDIPNECKDIVNKIQGVRLANRDIIIKDVRLSSGGFASGVVCHIEFTDSTTDYLKNTIPGAELASSYIDYDPILGFTKSASFNRIVPSGYFEMVFPNQCRDYPDAYCEIGMDSAKSLVTFNVKNIGTADDVKDLITDFYGKF
ncbi:MAG: hypothetical protein ACP5GJ_03910 [Nanopusillaceae archaeon]|jgi:hypothetical protein